MNFNTNKLENYYYFFFVLQNWGLTGDVLERCKNRWSYGGHDNSGKVQVRTAKQKKLVSLVQKLAKYEAVFKNIHFY